MSTPAPGAKLSREEYRRQKDLEAARKAGTAAPALDEDGKAINPHIPEFMAQAPWYMATGGGPSLKHHKAPGVYNADPEKLKERFNRGVKAGPAATKFRKGACTNCGAMTHSVKDCLERPRKAGAKYTHANIAPDEIIHDSRAGLNGLEGMGDFDAKRDRWDGYDPSQHKLVVKEYEALEEARRKLREEQIDKGAAGVDEKAVVKAAKVGKGSKKKKKTKEEQEQDDFGSESDSDGDGGEGDDEDKYADGADVAGQKLDTKNRVTVRNLRIREDTAKYLRNLDPESAYYDPKTRSMREAPVANERPEDAVFAGDNFARHSGGAAEVQRLQLFAWQSEQRGNDVHINSNPTQSHLLHREFLEKKDELKETSSKSILSKYGGEEYLQTVPRELLGGQTEEYVEYSRSGQVVKGRERAKARSKYEEDVFPGNHRAIFGSWYNSTTGQWGLACCHQVLKSSYCTGQAGIDSAQSESTGNLALLTAAPPTTSTSAASSLPSSSETQTQTQNKRKALDLESDGAGRKRAQLGEGDVSSRLDKKKVEDALEGRGESFKGKAVTEEEMEAYRLQRENKYDDPAAMFKDSEELLPL